MLELLAILATSQKQTAHSPIPPQFPYTRALPILDKPGSESEQVRTLVVKSASAPPAFVAEDGTAFATWSGTVTKIDVRSGTALVSGDKYRIGIRGTSRTAFNVSQEKRMRKSYKGWLDLPLRPLLLLDRYRTICVNGPLSAATALDRHVPRRTLFVVLIDDRDRRARPNRVVSVQVPAALASPRISVIGTDSGTYILKVSGLDRERFLAVNPGTMGVKWIRWGGWQGFVNDLKAIRRSRPSFYSLVMTRWAGRSYFLSPDSESKELHGYRWSGGVLEETGQLYMPAASANGRFGWLVNRDIGLNWLLKS